MKSTVVNVHFWGGGCLRWNKTTGKVEVESSRIRWILWLRNFLLHLAHVTFLFFRYIQFNHVEESAKASVKVYTEYAVVAYAIPLMFSYFRLDDLVDFLNKYSDFYGSVDGSPVSLITARQLN